MDLRNQLGYDLKDSDSEKRARDLVRYLNLKLAALGCPVYQGDGHGELNEIAAPLLANHREKARLLEDHLCPADRRIRDFLVRYLDLEEDAKLLPGESLTLDRHGLARVLSLPPDRDSFSSKVVESFRIKQGVLHNPENDRR